ncbi:hypothetical protein Kpol_1060p27 [Vanderwaltozyma polyspora DSM 70294]|uniref:UDP-galactose transporter homolog 1 n=1 Tax=Vanderwaltozyma polyspora (strain ATCC 22028 / DSM 70294 / BCRC 21397 / CBS 2163 / NBRC 10782 / NRRL Y-8283 / UCD 57-17) TaxID=436907 RepID=A7TK25_VANPO|nr:uncharacterized protein Kpol_1060p27 [Vanderwaltozyma polyspora DSM 70294]EDO17371.1 hypothetical protein Kpol_1060p27 [Vanderwaltozyma polyspora DSM 70294]
MGQSNVGKLVFCAVGIYVSFLTWALVQEPLNTNVWENSNDLFKSPNVVAVAQGLAAMILGYLYLNWMGSQYSPIELIWDYKWDMALTSLTQSFSAPLAAYSLQYVDYLTYMLAKSCKMIPILLVHLLLYGTSIPRQKKLISIFVTIGVTIFTIGGNSKGSKLKDNDKHPSAMGFVMLLSSLFMDGLTNATQDKMLKSNRKNNSKNSKDRLITGAHLMFALNMFIIIWNLSYLMFIDKSQWQHSLKMMTLDPVIVKYLITYAICGAIGQCFIFFTLQNYGSLVLVMITVTRKMVSMLLSIVVFGKSIKPFQWIGIFVVFAGISWEAIAKKKTAEKVTTDKKEN